jgi:hypothetical protein
MPAAAPLQAMETGDCLSVVSLQLSRSLELTLEHVAESIKSLEIRGAVSSSHGLYNEAGENALACANKNPRAGMWHMDVKLGQTITRAVAVRIAATGWFLITIDTSS